MSLRECARVFGEHMHARTHARTHTHAHTCWSSVFARLTRSRKEKSSLYLRIISGIYTCPRVHFRGHMLQHIVVNYKTLQHAATRVSSCALQRPHAATYRSTLQDTATRCNTLQHAATRCNTLQHAATRVSSHMISDACTCPRVHVRKLNLNMATHHNNLQHTATTCNTQQLTCPRASLFCA